MSLSDEDDDFLSADEDTYDNELDDAPSKLEQNKSNQAQPIESLTKSITEQRPSQDPVLVEASSKTSKQISDSHSQVSLKCSASPEQLDLESPVSGQNDDDDNDDDDDLSRDNQFEQNQQQDEDEENLQMERIRERNLMITRKFSNELVEKVLKATPAPVNVPPRDRLHSETSDYNSPDKNDPRFPPAPPPTPALSSSPTSTAVLPDTSKTSTQYSWRLPPGKQSISTSQLNPLTGGGQAPATASEKSDTNTHQARLALDRLSEKVTHQKDRSLFDLVAEDIKKVAIGASPDAGSKNQTSPTGAGVGDEALPSLVELGSSIGNWGWSNATKLLSSATKVTSEVTSQVTSQVNAILAPTDVKKDNK